ncbi:MAG: hypothetical protein QXJ62_04085, partial [Nitrososphaeria archaeon]
MKIKQSFLELFLGIVLPISVAFLLLNPLLMQKGIPFYGDETYYYITPNSFYFNPFAWLFSWIPAYGPAPPFLTLFSYSAPLISMTCLFGQELAVKLFILAVASLPAILTFFALRILDKEWGLFNNEGPGLLFASVSSIFMLVSFTNAGLVGAATAPAWSYLTLPLSFALFVRYIRKGLIKDLLSLCVVSLFAIANPFWIYLMAIIASLYLIIEVLSGEKKRLILKRLILVTLSILTLHSFWVVPTIGGYIFSAGALFQSYTTEQLISFEGLRFLSHWTLLDVLMVGEHQYYFFWLHLQNYGPLSVIIPLMAIATVLIFRRNKYVLFTALILVIGIFLTKGVHEPGGYLYYFVAKNLPYGAGALLRNPTKFVPLVTFSYAILIGLFVAKVYEKLGFFKFKGFILKPSLIKYGALAVLALLVLSPVTYGTLLDLQGYTWPRYKPTYIPQIYDDVNSWLSQQQGNFKVMWIPSGGSYVWKPYIITAFPDLLSSRPAVSFYKIYPEPLTSTDRIGDVLTPLGVKYIIYHGD